MPHVDPIMAMKPLDLRRGTGLNRFPTSRVNRARSGLNSTKINGSLGMGDQIGPSDSPNKKGLGGRRPAASEVVLNLR